MDEKNLDIYGHKPIPWSRARAHLEAQTSEQGHGRTYWLATVGTDGRPHVAAVGALWLDGKFYFTSGAATRKSRNLAKNASCTISVSLGDLDLVVDGNARKVTDAAMLERVANLYADQGWPARASEGAITAEFSAPSAPRRGTYTRSRRRPPSELQRPSHTAQPAGASSARCIPRLSLNSKFGRWTIAHMTRTVMFASAAAQSRSEVQVGLSRFPKKRSRRRKR